MKSKARPAGKPAILSHRGKMGRFSHKEDAVAEASSSSKEEEAVTETAALDVAPFDTERHCPRLTTLLGRAVDDPPTADELDPLQHELEQTLLHNMALQRAVVDQLSALTGGQLPSSAQMKGASRPPAPPASVARSDGASTSRQKIGFEGVARLPRDSLSSGGGASAAASSSFTPVAQVDSLGRRRVCFWPQNHMPDKFWQFVAEHCAPVSDDDVAMLRQMIREQSAERLTKHLRLPARGKHYTRRWSEEDAKKQTSATATGEAGSTRSKAALKRKSGDAAEAKGARPVEPKKRGGPAAAAENGGGGDAGLGPLTERLVQALIQEQCCQLPNGATADAARVNGSSTPSKALVKSLNLGNMAALERRIKRELKAHGILNSDDEAESDAPSSSAEADDEVTSELRVRQNELQAVTQRNRALLETVLAKAVQFYETTQVRDQLADTDNDLLDLYGRFYSLVPKRKPSSKKERDALFKVLNERERLIRQLQ